MIVGIDTISGCCQRLTISSFCMLQSILELDEAPFYFSHFAIPIQYILSLHNHPGKGSWIGEREGEREREREREEIAR